VRRGTGRVFGVAVSLALETAALPGDATAADITVDAAEGHAASRGQDGGKLH
jgi:hypothetical protein